MSKEYVLAIMEEKTGMLVCDIEVGERLEIKVRSCDAVIGAQHVAVRNNDAEFFDRSLKRAKATAKKIGNEKKNYIPVVIECDVKVTTLDGKEIDRLKLVEEHRKNEFSLDFLNGLID